MLFTLQLWCQVSKVASKELACEEIHGRHSWVHVGYQVVCKMEWKTSIFSQDVVTSPQVDEVITGVSFWHNRKVQFLPLNVGKTYPNLIGYMPEACSLTSISRVHFQNMTNLRALWLNENQIEQINGDTFSDLPKLEWIRLGRKPSLDFLLSFIQLDFFLIQMAIKLNS